MLSYKEKRLAQKGIPSNLVFLFVLILWMVFVESMVAMAEDPLVEEQLTEVVDVHPAQTKERLPTNQEMFEFISLKFKEIQQVPDNTRSAQSLTYGSPVSQIGTFNGQCVWLGWVGSFSESYLPESENYAWVLYFAPEGVYVALQNSCSLYSSVDVFASVGSFFGVMAAPDSPDRSIITKDYLESLLGVMLTLNISSSLPAAGPLSQLGVGLSFGPTFFRQGTSKVLVRGFQYNAAWSISYSLVPFSLPGTVALDYGEPECEINPGINGFWPIMEWDLGQIPEGNPINAIVPKLEEMAKFPGSTFVQIISSQMAQMLLPFLRGLVTSGSVTLVDDLSPLTPADYFGHFLQNNSPTVPGSSPNTSIDYLIKQTEEWLQTGDTSQLPDAVSNGLSINGPLFYNSMKPIQSGTDLAFEVAYKRGCDANANCTTLYADCVTHVHCTPGEICRLEVTTEEISSLFPGSDPSEFEEAWLLFENPVEQYMTTEGSETWVQIENGKAVFEFIQSSDNPLVLTIRIDPEWAPVDRWVRLCPRMITFTSPKGDVNGDELIDLTDAVTALQVMSKIGPLPALNKGADVNGDVKVGMEEIIYILQELSEVR